MTIRTAFVFDDYSFSTTEVQDAILELNAIAQLPPETIECWQAETKR